MAKTTQAQINISLAMQAIAGGLNKAIKEIAGREMGFCLVIFNEEDNGYVNYVANTDRQLTIDALKSLIEKWEKGMPDIPCHKRQ